MALGLSLYCSAQVALEDDEALLDGQAAEHVVVDAELGVAGGEFLAQRLGLAVAGLGEPPGRALHTALDEFVGLLVRDEPEGEVAAGGHLGLDAVGDQPGQAGPDGQVPLGQLGLGGREPGRGADRPRALALTCDGEVEAYVPDRVHDAERAQALGEVGRGLPGDGLALVPHGGHGEAEGLEAHARTAGVELQLRGEPGVGRDHTERVGDAPGQPDGAVVLRVSGQRVAQEHLLDRLGVVTELGDVQDVPGEGVVLDVLGAPVHAPLVLDERRGDLVAVAERVHGGQQVVPVGLVEEVRADGVDRLDLVEGDAVDRLQVGARDLRELLAVGLVTEGQLAQVQHQVVLEPLDVLGELQLQQAVVGQELVDPAVDLHAVREVGDLVAPVADGLHGRLRLVHDPPLVHPVRDERDAAGGHVDCAENSRSS